MSLGVGTLRVAFSVAVAFALIGLAPAGAGAAGDRRIRHVRLTFVDRSRPTVDPTGPRSAATRTLVTQVYIPRGKGKFPLIVMAHGNAGNPGKVTQMLTAWAQAGSSDTPLRLIHIRTDVVLPFSMCLKDDKAARERVIAAGTEAGLSNVSAQLR